MKKITLALAMIALTLGGCSGGKSGGGSNLGEYSGSERITYPDGFVYTGALRLSVNGNGRVVVSDAANVTIEGSWNGNSFEASKQATQCVFISYAGNFGDGTASGTVLLRNTCGPGSAEGTFQVSRGGGRDVQTSGVKFRF